MESKINDKKEIKNLQEQKFTTKRATVEQLEEILYEPIKVLDHGFIRVVDYMGDDSAIVQAARVSYGKGTKMLSQDKGLINYLMRHYHTTPFEMCEIKLHVKLPIFIARQWIRHRTANVNEYSARYSILDKEFYLPDPQNIEIQSQSNKQGREGTLDPSQAQRVLDIIRDDSLRCYDNYMELLNLNEKTGEINDPNKEGIARELARMNLTLNYYTQWYWKIDLNNLLHFLRLRADSHAQYEIREYSNVILDIVSKWVPLTYEAFINYRKDSINLSKTAVETIKRMLKGEKLSQESSGMSKREWSEFCDAFLNQK
ncbi:FAD-dependent thymidylate synthase [Candidatus Bandiella numerosa]|uniref:FAD-dependent thymidylate synthase n=1 Tax=Candidatus Bandiella numerosa TaxID=2570586 RepID=UPI00249E3B87|nr:FAD-dependent thymidylate synthase [Candidatus Bandiella numerosa]WHA05422.1 FAD-dependent thymidylate synthase [Candidatus Bandiella numerosa]